MTAQVYQMLRRSHDNLDRAEAKRFLANHYDLMSKDAALMAKALRAEADILDPPSTWINAPVRGSHEGHE